MTRIRRSRGQIMRDVGRSIGVAQRIKRDGPLLMFRRRAVTQGRVYVVPYYQACNPEKLFACTCAESVLLKHSQSWGIGCVRTYSSVGALGQLQKAQVCCGLPNMEPISTMVLKICLFCRTLW